MKRLKVAVLFCLYSGLSFAQEKAPVLCRGSVDDLASAGQRSDSYYQQGYNFASYAVVPNLIECKKALLRRHKDLSIKERSYDAPRFVEAIAYVTDEQVQPEICSGFITVDWEAGKNARYYENPLPDASGHRLAVWDVVPDTQSCRDAIYFANSIQKNSSHVKFGTQSRVSNEILKNVEGYVQCQGKVDDLGTAGLHKETFTLANYPFAAFDVFPKTDDCYEKIISLHVKYFRGDAEWDPTRYFRVRIPDEKNSTLKGKELEKK